MREIVHVQVGQCGNQIGTRFWEKICAEHYIDGKGACSSPDPTNEESRLSVYFTKVSENRYVPRCLIVDLESGTSTVIKSSPLGDLFKPENIIHAQSGAGNNFAKGYYTEGAELLDSVLESIRKEAETCANVQGFQVVHSSGGGTGSGMGSHVISSLKDEFPDKVLSSFTVIPSKKVSDVVVEPYNACLTLSHLLDSATESFCLENESLYDICANTLKIDNPGYQDMNGIVSEAMCGITSCVRFPGQLNSDVRKLAVNMIPFPRQHFLISSYAPLGNSNSQQYRSLNVADITQQMFDSKNMMTTCDPNLGKYFAVATIFRGNVSMKEVEDQISAVHRKNEKIFIPWIPNNVLTASCSGTQKSTTLCGTFIGNSTSIAGLHTRIADSCKTMSDRKAFLHWYVSEGLEQEEIVAAYTSLFDLASEYKRLEELSL